MFFFCFFLNEKKKFGVEEKKPTHNGRERGKVQPRRDGPVKAIYHKQYKACKATREVTNSPTEEIGKKTRVLVLVHPYRLSISAFIKT